MKIIFSKFLLAAVLLTFGLLACTKMMTNTYFPNGKAPVLSASTTTIAPPTMDSLNSALVLSWTNPKYATDSATELYIIQIDSSGRNFSKAVSISVSGALYDSIISKQLNVIALGFGFSFNVAYKMDIRLISSYANNNEQYTSNTITITYTPYVIPPKVQPPSPGVLFITGSATVGSWQAGNGIGVPVPLQQFTQIDSVTYTGTFFLYGGGAYDLLPVNGSWSTKYNVASSAVSGISSGGAFQFSTGPGNDIPAPAKSGVYTILVNFQTGIFTVTPVNVFSYLWVPGDYQSWAPASAPTLASPTANGSYEGYVNITTLGGFKFTSEADWNGTNYGDTAANGESGVLNAGGGNNLNITATGYYLIDASTKANTWTAVNTTWSLIGSFAASTWSTDIPMTYNSSSGTWTGTITTAVGDQFKFRANDAWTINYGDNSGNGQLELNGGNINAPATAGSHLITLNLSVPGYYFYTIQ